MFGLVFKITKKRRDRCVEKGFEKIILQFTTDFENTLLFKGGWGGSDAIKHTHRKNTLLLRDFLENGKKCDLTW
jgi:hypothetical protein